MTFHDDLDALREEFETHGYWYLDLRDAVGSLAVARYNFEEMPEFRFAIGTGETQAQALEQATDALSITDEPPIGSLHVGRFEGALDVVRDVVGWNTVYDAINDRPYSERNRGCHTMVQIRNFALTRSAGCVSTA